MKSWPCHIVTIHIFSNTRPNCILQLATFEPHAASGSLAGSGVAFRAAAHLCRDGAAAAERGDLRQLGPKLWGDGGNITLRG